MAVELQAQMRDRHGLVVTDQWTESLADGWLLTRSAPGELDHRLSGHGRLVPARVPGTVASALVDAGADVDALGDLDGEDWWFRCRFPSRPSDGDEQVLLRLDGLATHAEVWLNGTHLLDSDNMFRRHAVPVDGVLAEDNELVLGFRALTPLLADRRPRPRWHTRIVSGQGLRRHRTMILGRAPGFAPGPAAVGPWRQVALERTRSVALERALVRASLAGEDGVARVRLELRPLGGWHPETAFLEVSGPTGRSTAPLGIVAAENGLVIEGEVSVAAPHRWWPHTHGAQPLYDVAVRLDGAGRAIEIDACRIGFRSIKADPLPQFGLCVNGRHIFCRGGALIPDRILVDRAEGDLRALLERIRDAGMNMIRLSGVGVYGDETLYRVCDELGLLVWQDFAFANMDYPADDDSFRASVEAEAADFLEPIGRHPSLAVLCGGSEVEQQATMMGVDPAAAPGPLFDEVLPASIAAAHVGAPYVRSTPTGGALPIQPGAGIGHYYGVGAYRRPLEDARRAAVKFAAECLAFSNVPDDDALAELCGSAAALHGPSWKRGVPRDAGASWDFEDVRDHYLRDLYGLDPALLRAEDPDRYLELSRLVTGVVMAETLGEWRRAASPCQGALVWWLNDLLPGAGWGLLDARGRPKPSYWIARRVLAPVAVWTTDEGTNGVAIHVANDTGESVDVVLDVRLLRDGEHVIAHAERAVRLAPHSTLVDDVDATLGRFADAAYAYRFGPPQHDVVVVTLLAADAVISQSVRFPLGRHRPSEAVERLGLTAVARPEENGVYAVELETRRVVEGVRISAPGYEPDDDYLLMIPGFRPIVRMRPLPQAGRPERPEVRVHAPNRGGSVPVIIEAN